jgi:hypothetical protein
LTTSTIGWFTRREMGAKSASGSYCRLLKMLLLVVRNDAGDTVSV